MHYGEKLENFPIIRNATCIKGSVTRSGEFLDFFSSEIIFRQLL